MVIADVCACSGTNLRWNFAGRRPQGVVLRRRVDLRVNCLSAPDGGSSSYLEMWKKAMERERSVEIPTGEGEASNRSIEVMTDQFKRILEVPEEERDRAQRIQVIDRAAAAIAAARSLIKDSLSSEKPLRRNSVSDESSEFSEEMSGWMIAERDQETDNVAIHGRDDSIISPGPDFWSWVPPAEITPKLQPMKQTNPFPNLEISFLEKENPQVFTSLPFQSTLTQSQHFPPLPPLQSLMDTEEKEEISLSTSQETQDEFSTRNSLEAAEALSGTLETSQGINPDGTKWWKSCGVEEREDGVIFKWTLTRGVSADGAVEWEDKFWEAADDFDFKELGSEKSGRDAYGNVWREFWKETFSQDLSQGIIRLEKNADKWGKNGAGDEWHERWHERYDAAGQTEKWAHKWCSIDPTTPLDAGHAHVWHERWGEKYDGEGASTKYTDKWAERAVGDGWAKWGDKWDENFDRYGNGTKQGETWWNGEDGNKWNRTWGEHHNGSGWIHKYGKSSSGEHWDTHVKQDTWYEKFPHYGFDHCLRNSGHLMAVRKLATPPPMP